MTRITPAPLAFSPEGTPYAPAFDDVYHSSEGGPGQARAVFLAGNGLPAAWGGRDHYTVFETGFGLGVNFLTTWAAWRADPARCGRLHCVSVEKHPFTQGDLARLHPPGSELAPLAADLVAAWPVLTPGLHRLEFEDGRVTLTLALGDLTELLPRLWLGVDAFYLDGFSPARNPQMWEPRVFKALARIARPGASLATYTAAGTVREGLAQAGFQVEKRPGFGRKRHMVVGRFAPRWRMRAWEPPTPAPWPERRALVVGAGMAGAAVAEALCRRGWQVELLERQPGPAMETSGNHAGLFHPHLSPDDSRLSRLTRAGHGYALSRWRALAQTGELAWSPCGVVQLAQDASEAGEQAATVARLGFPPAFAGFLDTDAARTTTGLALEAGGYHFPEGGWIRPPSLVKRLLAACGGGLTPRYGQEVATLAHEADRWVARDAAGQVIARAPVVVLANAAEATRLLPLAHLPLRRVRGQVSLLPAQAASPHIAIGGKAYLLPPVDGLAVTGATYDFDDEDTQPRLSSHQANLQRLTRVWPPAADLDPARLAGRAGFRCVTQDRLPAIGPVPDETAARARAGSLGGAHSRDIPRLPGAWTACAYGSRGLVWSMLGAELIACQITGEPMPLELDLAEALDPARFLVRALRKGRG